MNGRPVTFTLRHLGRRKGWHVRCADGSTGTGALPGDALNRALASVLLDAVTLPDGSPNPSATLLDLSGVLAGIAEAWGPEVLTYAIRRWQVGAGLAKVRRPVGLLRWKGAA